MRSWKCCAERSSLRSGLSEFSWAYFFFFFFFLQRHLRVPPPSLGLQDQRRTSNPFHSKHQQQSWPLFKLRGNPILSLQSPGCKSHQDTANSIFPRDSPSPSPGVTTTEGCKYLHLICMPFRLDIKEFDVNSLTHSLSLLTFWSTLRNRSCTCLEHPPNQPLSISNCIWNQTNQQQKPSLKLKTQERR